MRNIKIQIENIKDAAEGIEVFAEIWNIFE